MHIRARIKSAHAQKTFATISKARARSCDQLRFLKQQIKRVPTCQTRRTFQPDIRRVLAAPHLKSLRCDGFAKNGGVGQIEITQRLHLLLPLGSAQRGHGFLYRPTHAIATCAPSARPQTVKRNSLAVTRAPGQLFWDNSKTTSKPRKSTIFREAAKFHRAFFGARNFKNAPRYVGVANVRLVRGVKQYQRVVAQSPIHPPRKRHPAHGGTGWIIGRTQIRHIHRLRRWFWNKSIFWSRIHVHQALVTTVFHLAGVASHDIGVHIHRVHRIRNPYHISTSKQF